jgi:hypothetical protein
MRKLALLPCSLLLLAGCGGGTSYVKSDTTLGRVVVYRNGVAYFERYAKVDGDSLSLAVPADKVDDFLKSLTGVDAKTGKPAPVGYPTSPASIASPTGLIDMTISLPGMGPHELKLSYVTEAPSWKPTYRVVLEKGGKVSVQGWAIVDNTSGEDWKSVKLGVGSSSALSFHFDLQSVRMVQRETLRSDDLFALAPPTGGSTHGRDYDGSPAGKKVVMEVSDETLQAQKRNEAPVVDVGSTSTGVSINRSGTATRSFESVPGVAAGVGGASGGRAAYGQPAPMAPPRIPAPARPSTDYKSAPAPKPTVQKPPEPYRTPEQQSIDNMARALQTTKNQIVVEGYADPTDGDKFAASLDRANRVREQLLRNGIAPERVVAVGQGQQSGRKGGVRIVEAQPTAAKEGTDAAKKAVVEAAKTAEPIGTSHFESQASMTVARGTSAMVSILQTETDGEVVYFYDPESARGNAAFPFRAVRIRNPTDSVLESGPVTVFGDGKFIGEGLADPIPARSVAFVPFALDRQIVVDKDEARRDDIARVISVQRGVFSNEVQHTRKTTLTLNNRLDEKATVYIRHSVPQGYKLTKSPPSKERFGSAHLFRVEVPASGKIEVVIEEATPLFKTADIRSPEGLALIKLYLSSAALDGPLKTAVTDLIKVHQDMDNLSQQIATMREQMTEYRSRMDELHVQIVSLRAVKTKGGNLLQHLEKKLQEVSEKLSTATVDLVGVQEKLMVARIRFQDGVAELSLEKKEEANPAQPAQPAKTL